MYLNEKLKKNVLVLLVIYRPTCFVRECGIVNNVQGKKHPVNQA